MKSMTDISFTYIQGQYLAFIHLYTKLHSKPPSERDIQNYFKVTPPTVHQMVVKLHSLGLIERKPKTPRSLRVLVEEGKVPNLNSLQSSDTHAT